MRRSRLLGWALEPFQLLLAQTELPIPGVGDGELEKEKKFDYSSSSSRAAAANLLRKHPSRFASFWSLASTSDWLPQTRLPEVERHLKWAELLDLALRLLFHRPVQ